MDWNWQKQWLAALVCACTVAHAGSALAQPVYWIANAPAEVPSGAPFTVDVVLDLAGSASTGHEVSVRFAPGLLVAEAASELGVPPYEFNISSGVRGIHNAAGFVDQIEAGALAPIGPVPPFVVGQIEFRAGEVGEAAIIPFFGPGAAVLDGMSQPIDGVAFEGATVRVVPAPTPTPSATALPSATPTPSATPGSSGSPVPTATATPTATPTPTPASTPSATPTPTPSPTPGGACRCEPHWLVPVGNLAILRETASGGDRSEQTRRVGVILRARGETPGACQSGSSASAFSLRLQIIDEDGDVILDETREDLTCDRRARREKFAVRYGPENCARSEAPSEGSTARIKLIATTEHGELIAHRALRCRP